jgi:hypothetical protein
LRGLDGVVVEDAWVGLVERWNGGFRVGERVGRVRGGVVVLRLGHVGDLVGLDLFWIFWGREGKLTILAGWISSIRVHGSVFVVSSIS